MNIYNAAFTCLMEQDPAIKKQQTQQLYQDWQAGKYTRLGGQKVAQIIVPGRPAKPELVSPQHVKHRKLNTAEGRATLIHAIAHIEFNAINLALDAVYRFREMPDQYYTDWLQVASEEAYHFSLLRERLQELGVDYGDMPAHNGLWEMCVKTDTDVMTRMALVPRVLEARGLDVTPAMMERLTSAGDHQTVSLLAIILRDEIGHVRIGSHWFKHCCAEKDLEPITTFRQLLHEHMNGSLRGPFHTEARLQAGFSAEEMQELEKMLA